MYSLTLYWVLAFFLSLIIFLYSAINYINQHKAGLGKIIISAIIVLTFPLIVSMFGREMFSQSVIFLLLLLVAPLLVSGFLLLLVSVGLKLTHKHSDKIGKLFVTGIICFVLALALFDESVLITDSFIH